MADWFAGVWAWTDEEVGSRETRAASPIRSSSSFGARRREVVRTRGEEGRDLPDGENRLDVSRRVVRRRHAGSGSAARRRGAFMTYPPVCRGQKSGGGGADRGRYFRAMLMILISVDDSEYGLQT